jgi:hypothetical protein
MSNKYLYQLSYLPVKLQREKIKTTLYTPLTYSLSHEMGSTPAPNQLHYEGVSISLEFGDCLNEKNKIKIEFFNFTIFTVNFSHEIFSDFFTVGKRPNSRRSSKRLYVG